MAGVSVFTCTENEGEGGGDVLERMTRVKREI